MPSPSELAHQLHDHLEGWQAAGLTWLPRGQPLPPAQPRQEDAASPGLFQKPAAVPIFNSAQKEAACASLQGEVRDCIRCAELARTRKQTVFGVGNLNAELCFVGEAPGADEDVQGEPFVGAAGQLLNRIIAACGMTREEVYICNVLKCRPPGNRTPAPDEQANCRPFLERQLAIIQPKFLCGLGAVAAQWLTGSTLSIGKLRGRVHRYQGIPVVCTYHPAYLLRNPAAKKDVWEDMKFLLAKMGRPVPSQK